MSTYVNRWFLSVVLVFVVSVVSVVGCGSNEASPPQSPGPSVTPPETSVVSYDGLYQVVATTYYDDQPQFVNQLGWLSASANGPAVDFFGISGLAGPDSVSFHWQTIQVYVGPDSPYQDNSVYHSIVGEVAGDEGSFVQTIVRIPTGETHQVRWEFRQIQLVAPFSEAIPEALKALPLYDVSQIQPVSP